MEAIPSGLSFQPTSEQEVQSVSQPNGNSDIIARRYMDRLIIEERVLGSVQPALRGGGTCGVAAKLRAMTTELASIMYRTGSDRVDSIDPGVIHEAWWM